VGTAATVASIGLYRVWIAVNEDLYSIFHTDYYCPNNSRNHFVLIIATSTVTTLWNF
jgi:hypothetical protein